MNSAFLQSIHPSLGFINLPFNVTDETMLKPGATEAVIQLVQTYVEPTGLKVLGLMRGADTIFVFKNHQVRRPEDLKGLKIRVAGPGVYQEVVRGFGAEPSVIPAIEMGSALQRGLINGMYIPGGMGKECSRGAPRMPGSGTDLLHLFHDCRSEVANGAAGGPATGVIDAARINVTEKWRVMQQDDQQLVSAPLPTGGPSTGLCRPMHWRPGKARRGRNTQVCRCTSGGL